MTLRLAQQRIDWFKSRGYLLGQNKKRYYIVDGMGQRHDFDEVWQAQQFVENMAAYRYQTEHPEERY